jgi:hypothetical protein
MSVCFSRSDDKDKFAKFNVVLQLLDEAGLLHAVSAVGTHIILDFAVLMD